MYNNYHKFLANEFKQKFNELDRCYKSFERSYKLLNQFAPNEYNLPTTSTNIIKDIVKYMVAGFYKNQAIRLVAEKMHISEREIANYLKTYSYEEKAIKLYAKVYLIKKMKQAEYTRQQIADVLHISPRTIDRLSKTELKY